MIAIKFGDFTDPTSLVGIIYLDATTDFQKDFGGKVTSHPIEAGVSVSDHFISENPKIRVSGVISGADLSAIPSNLVVEGSAPLNANPQPPAAIVSDLPSTLRKLIPDTIGQWIPNTVPTIIGGDSPRVDYKEEVETLLEEIMSGVYYNEQRKRWQNRMTLITLYETAGSYIGRSIPNLVLTGYRTKEDADTGDALLLDLSFEQVRFATLESAEAPAPQKGSDTAKAASKSKDKGAATAKDPLPDEIPDQDRVFSVPLLQGNP